MGFLNGDPRIAQFLSGRESLLPRGPIRQHISELLVKHGTNFRTPESITRHAGLVVLPFIEDLMHGILKRRASSLAAE